MTQNLVRVSRDLSRATREMRFQAPVAYVYAPLEYARGPHERYLERWGSGRKQVLLLGMNPGPFGMAQTGVPFGDVGLVKGWLGIEGAVTKPAREHPARPIHGFACARGEVSGQRLWGFVRDSFGTPARFFERFFVWNYCPLAFVEASGRNRTPDKLAVAERKILFERCDLHLREIVEVLEPGWLIGVGDFAATRCELALGGRRIQIGKILHPSPACPASNIDWAGKVTRQLQQLGVWD